MDLHAHTCMLTLKQNGTTIDVIIETAKDVILQTYHPSGIKIVIIVQQYITVMEIQILNACS